MSVREQEDGGPAFPTLTQVQKFVGDRTTTGGTHPTYECQQKLATGMSLRDWFAGQALTGILSGNHPITRERDCQRLSAEVAYVIADAMLKARVAKATENR